MYSVSTCPKGHAYVVKAQPNSCLKCGASVTLVSDEQGRNSFPLRQAERLVRKLIEAQRINKPE